MPAHLGLVGKKVGMTRIFNEDGSAVPVSIVQIEPNRITRVSEINGHLSVQLTTGEKKLSHVNKPLAGHYAKAQVQPGIGLWEFWLDEANDHIKVGNELTVKLFESTRFVDVVGTSKGKGFAGTVKRHNFRTKDATHGCSLSHRTPGSIGQRQSPGKVFKGKRMAGQLGNKRVTVQNLNLVKVDIENNLLFIHGAIAGAPGSIVIVFPAVKKQD